MAYVVKEALHDIVKRISKPRARVTYNPSWHIGEREAWITPSSKQFYTQLNEYDQISVNTRDYKNAIVFDVDKPDSYLPPEITPYTSTFNKTNNKHHALFLLDKPIFTKSAKQKEWYRDNIGSALQRIYFLTNADTEYKNFTTKNPFNEERFRVNYHGNTLKSVFDLISLYNNDLTEVGKIEAAITKENAYISPKYRAFVSALIEHSHINAKLTFNDRKQFELIMYIKSEHLALEIGLNKKEAKVICSDAIEKSFAWSDLISKRQQLKISKRWGNQVESNKVSIAKAIHALNCQSVKPTKKKLAEVTGLSYNTITKPLYSAYIRELLQ